MNLKRLLFPAIVLFITVIALATWGFTKNTNSPISDNQANNVVNSTPTISNTPTQKTPSDRCIITINGSNYDVTELRSTHPGGNVFNCGTDMTAMFEEKHGTNFGIIAQFKVQN